MRTRTPVEWRRRLESASGATACAWITCAPVGKELYLNDDEFTMAVRLRLGAPLLPSLPELCPFCDRKPRLADAPTHLISCHRSMHAAGASTRGHNLLSSALTLLRRVGVSVGLEPRQLAADAPKRPDATITDCKGKVLLSDHTVINPLAHSRARASLKAIFQTAAATKRRKYDAMAVAHRATFLPMLFTCHGASNDGALKLLRLEGINVNEDLAQRWRGSVVQAANFLTAAMACAIQRRNALIARTVASAMRARIV